MVRGWLTPEELGRALEKQTIKGGRLGEILVSDGRINEQQLGETLAEQAGMPFAPAIKLEDLDRDLVRQFPINHLKQARALPLHRDEAGTLVMVTHNLNEIRQTCSRAIWLESGQIVMDGPADDVANATSYSGTPGPIAARPASIIAMATSPAWRAICNSSSDLIMRISEMTGVTSPRTPSSTSVPR